MSGPNTTHDEPNLPRDPASRPKTVWLVFVLLEEQRQHVQLYASQAEAVGDFLKVLQRIADEQDVPSLAEALAEPEIFGGNHDLSHYRNVNPSWLGHLEYLQNEQDLPIDAWILELNLP